MDRKVVFISYSHASPEHPETVLGPGERLRQEGSHFLANLLRRARDGRER